MSNLIVRFLLRRDTAENWTSTNPILADGEQGYETDTKKMKIGNGTTAWSSLPYFTGGGGTTTTPQTTSGIILDAGKPNTSYTLTPTLDLGEVTGTEDKSFMRTLIYAAFI